MTSIHFAYPYLLLVAIPLIGLSLIPYFKTAKKYRRTRNRIVSLVLHCVTIVLVTLALSGITFVQKISNTANELILVVDMSDTQEESADNRDGFVSEVLKESVYQNFTVGVVTFGRDQVYAAPLTTDASAAYKQYKEATLPDTSATDIEAALEYTRALFEHPETSKIVLVTDGKETDGNIVNSSTTSGILAQGTRFDIAYISSEYTQNEYQVLGVELPKGQITEGVKCTFYTEIYTKEDGDVRINLYDNGKHVEIIDGESSTLEHVVNIKAGKQTVPLTHIFEGKGLHELKIELVSVQNGARDEMSVNNVYFTYANLEVFQKVLIIEKFEGDSVDLKDILLDGNMLGEDGVYDVSLFNLQNDTVIHYAGESEEEGKVPETVDDLRQYDQIIMNNVASADLEYREIPLDKLLYSYVYDYGGSMLTVGGKDPNEADETKSYAYNRSDMRGKLYQKMLPVEAIDYTPPAGVVFIIDVSGSMDEVVSGSETRLDLARNSLTYAMTALNERDKVGIMTLGSSYSDILPMTPYTEKKTIENAIGRVRPMHSGTVITPSLIHAAEQLRAAQMAKNHVVVITDGGISDGEAQACSQRASEYYKDEKLKLSVSILIIGDSGNEMTKNIVAATREEGWFDENKPGEKGSGYYILGSSPGSTAEYLITDLNSKIIKQTVLESFNPVIENSISHIVANLPSKDNALEIMLEGFYGVKKKTVGDVDLVLSGQYKAPLYARWKFGRGNVGSFMCNLRSDGWAQDLLEKESGKQLIYNIINDLMPVSSIRPNEINLTLSEKNYSNHLTCPANLGEGETLRGVIRTPEGYEISLNEASAEEGFIVSRPLSEANKYSVCEFTIMKGGVYEIVLQKLSADGTVLASNTVFKEFSYSKEYMMEYEKTELEIEETLMELVGKGGGLFMDNDADVSLIFQDFLTELGRIFDPRILLIVLAAVLFLLDVAVRKFKFKWIHEIIRTRRAKKENSEQKVELENEKDN